VFLFDIRALEFPDLRVFVYQNGQFHRLVLLGIPIFEEIEQNLSQSQHDDSKRAEPIRRVWCDCQNEESDISNWSVSVFDKLLELSRID
jgi:hypothetical protein